MLGLYIVLALIVLAAVFMIGVRVGSGMLMKPVSALASAAAQLTRGDTDILLDVKPETRLGSLASDFRQVADTVNRLSDSVRVMTAAHAEGDMDARLDETKFNGVYKEVAQEINGMAESYRQHLTDICGVLRRFGEGDFKAEYKQLPGKKAVTNQVIEGLRKNLKDVDADIAALSKSARGGDLTARADAGKYSGDWAALLNELNALVHSIADKAVWYESLLDSVPLPIFATDINMKWTFMNKALEKMAGTTRREALGKPCNTMGTVICKSGNCAINNFKTGKTPTMFEQEGNHYKVTVAGLADSDRRPVGFVEVIQDDTEINIMLHNMHDLVANVKQVSDYVASGARQITESSQSLAEGAVNQSGSVEELNASIAVITEKTRESAKISTNAKELSNRAKQNALTGDGQMRSMLSAMSDIKNTSDNISKIIKTIEDIALNTNLLSLNASVEAARAGEHGKGFAVVAAEVGTLASRSQIAAKETAKLISDSIKSVETGMSIARNTAQSLTTIVSDFDKVSELVNQIALSSSEQEESIGQISGGIASIAGVTQKNSASSEETAAASQELSSQADVLKSMVSTF